MSDAMSDQRERPNLVKDYIDNLTIEQIKDRLTNKIKDEELHVLGRKYYPGYAKELMVDRIIDADEDLQSLISTRDGFTKSIDTYIKNIKAMYEN